MTAILMIRDLEAEHTLAPTSGQRKQPTGDVGNETIAGLNTKRYDN